jgi:hypothetical protein
MPFPSTGPPGDCPRSGGDGTPDAERPREDLEAALTRPRFRESDGPEAAARALERGLLGNPVGSNRSYGEFVTELRSWKVPAPRR